MPDGGFVAHLAPSGDPFSNGWNAAMKLQASQPASRHLPMPVNVIFHNPAILASSSKTATATLSLLIVSTELLTAFVPPTSKMKRCWPIKRGEILY